MRRGGWRRCLIQCWMSGRQAPVAGSRVVLLEPLASDRLHQTNYFGGRLRNLPSANCLLRWGQGNARSEIVWLNGVQQLGQQVKVSASHEHSRQIPSIRLFFWPDLTRVKFGSARLPLGLRHSHIFIAWFGFC